MARVQLLYQDSQGREATQDTPPHIPKSYLRVSTHTHAKNRLIAVPKCRWPMLPSLHVYLTLAVLGVPSAQQGEEVRNGYITLAVLGVPSAQHGEEVRSG